MTGWAGNKLACCQPTSFGGSTVHSPGCTFAGAKLNEDEWAIYKAGRKAQASEFNRKAEARALATAAAKQQAKDDHPAGKGPRYRSTQLWSQCSCRSPMAGDCKVHGAHRWDEV